MGETDHGAVFIDGTKLESRAGRYTFVWRKSTEKQLAKVRERLFELSGLEDKNDNQAWLTEWAQDVRFVHGKGHHKSPEQREWEKASELLERWEKYEDVLEIIGPGRNSCSKTDPDATFMRMKEDHMRNGQLKPGHNVQIAVNGEYITGLEVFSDRNDVHTLKPFLHKLEQKQQKRYREVVADAG